MIRKWMQLLVGFCAVFLVLVVLPSMAWADLPAVPDADPLTAFLNLFLHWKTMGPLAIGMSAIVAAMSLLKKAFGDFKYKRLIVTALALTYGVLLMVSAKVGAWEALVGVLITGGGAVALYDAIKGISGAARNPETTPKF